MKQLILLVCFFIFGCTNKPAMKDVVKLNGELIPFSNLDKSIQELVNKAKVTGLTVSIFNENQVNYQKAFGYSNFNSKDSLLIDEVFYGASLSKSVFAYLVAILAHDGIIDLDKPLQEYLEVPIPEMPFEKEWRGFKNLNDDPRYTKITARMCLSHTTGFPNWRWLSKVGEFQPEGKIKINFDPGSYYSYSGEGMMLLQYVIEKITDRGLEELAQEKVFQPLGMDMTSYVWQPKFEEKYCYGHNTKQEVLKKDTEDTAGAAGSMETTPVDYSKFMTHILDLEENNSPVTQLMFKSNIRIRSKNQFGPGAWESTEENDKIALSYGLGWGILQTPYGKGVFKEGHGEGFQHYSILFPDRDMGILLMSNSDNAESIFKAILELTIGDVYTPWKWELYIPYDLKADEK